MISLSRKSQMTYHKLDHIARFECIVNGSTTILTLDLNTVKVKLTDQDQGEIFDLQNKTVFNEISNSCTFANQTLQQFLLKFSPIHQLEFTFGCNSTRNSYHLKQIHYTRTENDDNDQRQTHYELNKPDLKFAGNELKIKDQGYKCGRLRLKLSLTEKQVNQNQNLKDHKAEIELNDFMFFAFENNVSTSEVFRIECRHDPDSSIIPVAVGAGLLGFAAVIVSTYLIIKKRENKILSSTDVNK